MSPSVAVEPVPLRADERGVWRVAGTRIPLDTVVTAYRMGDTPEQIAQDYSSLEVADIYAVIAYYLRHRTEVEAYLKHRQEQAESVRAEYRRRFPAEGIKERLQERLR